PLLVVIRLESSSRMILNAGAPLCKDQEYIITMERFRKACDRLGAGQNRRRDGLGKNNRGGNKGGNPASHTPAHDGTATAAPFRARPGSRRIVARGPTGSP